MASREFTITELKRAGDGGYVDTLVKFTWTNDNRAAPRGTWKFGQTQRTVREDYPGVDAPVEQVLGPNYKEQSLEGVWDDRHNYTGFALETQNKFEALVQRGSMVRLEFESISFTGILKDADYTYKRSGYIGYTFTISPHFRKSGGIGSGTTARRTPPKAFNPTDYAATQTKAMSGFMLSVHQDAPTTHMTGSVWSDVGELIADVQRAVATGLDTVDQRVGQAEAFITDYRRLANALNVIKGSAFDVISEVSIQRSDVVLSYDDAVASLDFDVWRTQLSAYARQMMLVAHDGAVELSKRADPTAVALYRPRAGESLYSISQRYYGTPTQWRTIADRNGLTTMVLQGNELLIIPQRRG